MLFAVLLGFAAFAALSLLRPGKAAAAPFDWGGRDWEGCAELLDLARAELGLARVVVTTKLDLHDLQPNDGVVILHPEKSLDVEALARFMRAGGRVVLLDDYGTGDALLQHFGMERVPLPERPSAELRGNPSLAIAEPASAHPVVVEVQHVVTNHATGIKHPDLTPVLEVRDREGHPALVAVAGAVSQGRLLVVGDPSIVMNSMLRYAGNKTFARNLVRYVGDEDPNGHGRGRVFFVEGAFEQAGTYGDESSLNGAMAERLRALRDALQSLRTEGMPPAAAFTMAVLVGLAIVIWTGSRAGRTHKASMPRFTRPIPLAAQGGVAGHAAVIGGPTTSRLLAMLELKSALEEDLSAAVGLEEAAGHEELVAALRARKWLDPATLEHLRALLLRMANVETMMLSQRAGATMQPVRDREVLAAARDARNIVKSVRAAAAAKTHEERRMDRFPDGATTAMDGANANPGGTAS
jgi:hypothetical protein